MCILFHIRIRFASSGFWLPSRPSEKFGVVRCPHTGPATCVFIPRGCTLRSWYTYTYTYIYNHLVSRGGGGRLVYNIHGILIADRSPEVRCSPLRFVMLSRQKWVVRCVALYSIRELCFKYIKRWLSCLVILFMILLYFHLSSVHPIQDSTIELFPLLVLSLHLWLNREEVIII